MIIITSVSEEAKNQKKIPINLKEIRNTRLQIKHEKSQKIKLFILLEFEKIKNLRKQSTSNYPNLRMYKSFILMIILNGEKAMLK